MSANRAVALSYRSESDAEVILALPSPDTVTGRMCRVILLEMARRAAEFDGAHGMTSLMLHIKLNGDRCPISIRVSPDYHRNIST